MNDFEFQLLKEGDVEDPGYGVLTMRPSRIIYLIPYSISSLVFTGLAAVMLGHVFSGHLAEMWPPKIPREALEFLQAVHGGTMWVLGFITIFAYIFVRMTGTLYRKTFNPRSWLIKAAAKGLYIQFRSFMNQNFDPNDATVLFIPSGKVEYLQEVRFTRVTKDSDGDVYQFMTALDIGTRGLDMDMIRSEIEKELGRRSPSGSRWGDSPVSVRDNDVIRVICSGMQPKAAALLTELKRWYAVRPKIKQKEKERTPGLHYTPPTPLSGTTHTEEDIKEALRKGHKIEAVKIARAVYGFGLKDAKDYVENLDL